MIVYKDTIKEDVTYVDARSPGEFEIDHIPGAVNIPILDNDERALVGTMYKQVDQDLAIKRAKEIYEEKVESIQKKLKKLNSKLIIYCWRGGMRSETITRLAKDSGLEAEQLKGGYKDYRKFVREHLYNDVIKHRLIVVHGLTGSGKTELLGHFRDRIDLEDLAQHRSSVYGAIGLKPRSQKMFESLLYAEIRKLSKSRQIIAEGESRKIGNIIIPVSFYKAMKRGINILVKASMETRVKRLVSIYTDSKKDIKQTRDITLTLIKKIGRKTVGDLLDALDKRDLSAFMRLLLEKYYDPLYRHTIDGLEYDIEVETDTLVEAVRIIQERYGLNQQI